MRAKAKVRNTEIYFDIEGAGLVPDGPRMRERPVAFLVHGGPGADHSIFKPGYSPLADRMQLVYFDHRGQGRSARGVAEKYTLDENVEDMEALREYLGLGPIVSIGASYGGIVTLAHAARYPASVSHLILIATAAHAGFHDRGREIVAERGTAEQQRIADRMWAGTLTTDEDYSEFFDVMGSLFSRYLEDDERLLPTKPDPVRGERTFEIWNRDRPAQGLRRSGSCGARA